MSPRPLYQSKKLKNVVYDIRGPVLDRANELAGVADVELEDLSTLRFKFIGAVQHRAADVVDDVFQFLGLVERAKTHCALFCEVFSVLVQKQGYTCWPRSSLPVCAGG